VENVRTRGRTLIRPSIAAGLLALALVGLSACALGPAAAPAPSLTASAAPTRPPVASFIGDSYSTPQATTTGAFRWSLIASEELGWIEDENALGGTGYLASTDSSGVLCERDRCPSFEEQVGIVAKKQPDIVVIAGGLNDIGFVATDPEGLRSAIDATYDRLAELLPDAQVIVVSPFTPGGPLDPAMRQIVEWVGESAAEHDFPVIEGADQWLTGDPEALSDGRHPSDHGQQVIAERFVEGVRPLIDGAR
jgi:lysophospholipase L1-like esterase